MWFRHLRELRSSEASESDKCRLVHSINKNKTMVSLTAKKVGNIREHKEIDGPLPMKIQALICARMLKTKRR